MKSYFDSQMRVLEEDVKIFAKQYPLHARHLNLDSQDDRDPSVERLLEGFAYLTGRIEQQLDNGLMGLSETLLENISPSSLKATPSKAIAQFSYFGDAEKKRIKLTPSDLLMSERVGSEQTHCHFSVETKQSIYPLMVQTIYQQETQNKTYELTLSLMVESQAANFSMNSLSVYFNGDLDFRLSWLYLLLTQCYSVTMQHNKKRYIINIQNAFLNEGALNASDPFGTELLKDYFSFRDKFMFVELIDLPCVEFSKNDEIDFIFELKKPLSAENLNKKNALLLGCMPVQNIFNYTTEPSTYEADKHACPLVLDACRKKSICLQSITDINSPYAIDRKLSYQSFSRYQKEKKNTIYYRLERQRSLNEAHHLILSGKHAALKQCLTISVNACNGTYPRKHLAIGALSFVPKMKSNNIVATNISRPTEYFPAMDNQHYYWRLLGMLSENYKNLSNRVQLLELLHAHDQHGHYQEKINALLETKINTVQRFKKGILYLGVAYSITLDDAIFLNEAEIYLFGSMLHFFLLHHVEINHFLTTKIRCAHNDKQFSWQAANGRVSRW